MKRQKVLVIPVLLAFFLVWRLALLLTSAHIGHFEEERQGNYAVLLLEGTPAELRYARPYDYEGSSVVSALAAVPVFSIFGPSGTALKAILLAVSALVLFLLLSIGVRTAGEAAAWTTGALFIFGPTMFVSYTFDTVGGAWWGCALNALILYAALRAFRDGRKGWVPAWGFLAGLGLFVHPSCFVAVAYTIGLLVLFRGPHLTWRILLLTALAFLAGLLPLLLLGPGEGSSFRMAADAFLERSYSAGKGRDPSTDVGPLLKAWTFAVYDMPHSLSLRILPLVGYLWACVLAAAFAASVVEHRWEWPAAARRLVRGPKESHAISVTTVVAGFVAFYMVLLVVSDVTLPYPRRWAFYDKNYKVLLNLLPYALLVAGLLAARLIARGGVVRWFAITLVAALSVLGLASGLSEMAEGSFSLRSRYPAHNLGYLGRAYAKNYDIENGIAKCRLHPEAYLPDCLEGVGSRALNHMMAERVPETSIWGLSTATCEAFEPRDKPICYRGVGWELNWQGGLVKPADTDRLCGLLGPFSGECMRGYMEITPDAIFNMPASWLEEFLDSLPEEDRRLLGPGFGVFLASRFHADAAFVFERCERIETGLGLNGCATAAARELGSLAGRTWPDARIPEGLTPDLASAWSRGLGEMLAWRHHDDPAAADHACDGLAGAVPSACREGLAYYRSLMDPANGAPLFPRSVKTR